VLDLAAGSMYTGHLEPLKHLAMVGKLELKGIITTSDTSSREEALNKLREFQEIVIYWKGVHDSTSVEVHLTDVDKKSEAWKFAQETAKQFAKQPANLKTST
jgi:hypothetical protein